MEDKYSIKMKSQTEEEILENTSGKTYDELLEDLKRLQRVSAKLYVPALCVAYKREHLNLENAEIRRHVMNDCELLGLWGNQQCRDSMPAWIKAEHLNTRNLEKALNSPKEQTRQHEASLLSRTTEAIEEELSTRQEPEEPSSVIVGEGTTGPPERYVPTPLEMHEDAIHGYDKTWQALTNKDHIIPAGGAQDVFNIHIKPSRKLRLRMFKGLDKQRAIYHHNMLVSMEMLIKDCLDMWDELKKEDTAKEIQQ